MFDKVLIANRGEIALRIMRTARMLGIRTVAVYSEADRDMPHVAAADQAVPIGPAPASESYLAIDRIIDAAKRTGAQAVHPGYGFLSENADFATACAAAAVTFIGPSPEAIRLMGNKAVAKRRMIEAGVPCVPGFQDADQSDESLARSAARLGFPLMVKAAAGGGGKGMRLVNEAAGLGEALRAARSEAEKAFGSAELILEKAIVSPRHVEIQVFGDTHGNVIHLGERDCSIQRRHQKVIEEAPCPVMTPQLRAAMGEAAVKAAKAIGYVGAGTIEFLLADGKFYFLEMNTRLQVEHPVTELVTGMDLVEGQFRVAAGEPLPLKQEQVVFNGHAIEARLYAEDPAHDFLPAAGRLIAWETPRSVRVDHGVASGVTISPHYDPMLAKIAAHGATRDEARRKLIAALRDTVVLGIATNRDFLIACLTHPAFAAGKTDTGFIAREMPARDAEPGARLIAAAAALMSEQTQYEGSLKHWRSTGVSSTQLFMRTENQLYRVEANDTGSRKEVRWSRDSHMVEVRAMHGARARLLIDGVEETAAFCWDDGVLHLALGDSTGRFEDVQRVGRSANLEAESDVALAPMTGTIALVHVKAGERVAKGQCLVVLEAMKMEHQVVAPRDGTVAAVHVAPGDQVTTRKRLVELAPLAAVQKAS